MSTGSLSENWNFVSDEDGKTQYEIERERLTKKYQKKLKGT
jgi:hypothetical protein